MNPRVTSATLDNRNKIAPARMLEDNGYTPKGVLSPRRMRRMLGLNPADAWAGAARDRN